MSVQRVLDKIGYRVITLPCNFIIADIIKTLAAESVGTVMLSDEKGVLVGILSERDVVRTLAQHGSRVVEMQARELMTQVVFTCRPESSLEDVLALMSANTIRHLPVVRDDEIVGLVSARDIMSLQSEQMRAVIERREQAEQEILRAKAALQEAYEELEDRILDRTDELRREITERKRIEEALHDSKNALHERIAQLEAAKHKLEIQGQDLVRFADDLRASRDQAESANRTKSQFLANMSHALRTPLNAIIGFSDIMKTEMLGPIGSVRYRNYANDINAAGLHLLALINDILDLSKVEANMIELFEENVAIPEVISSVMTLVRQRAEKNSIALELEIQERLPMMRGDERKIRQILANLLSNAIKFTKAGGEVKVRAWCRLESGFVFQIADTGVGIAPEDIPRTLTQFGQIDSDLNREFEGFGLGLPLTKALAELHGGTLDLQSEVGVGTTATVRFPATRVQQVPRDKYAAVAYHKAVG